MIRIGCLLFLLFMVLKTKAQNTFHPYKLDNIEWFEVEARYEMCGATQCNDFYYNFYKLCGDTVYNNTAYKKVYYGYAYNHHDPLPPWMIPTAPPSFSFYCFFRQDSTTKSNYYRMPTDTSDRLLVSYNLNIGDTIKQGEYRNHGFGQYWVVQKKDSLLYSGRKLNIFYTDTTYFNWQAYCGMNVSGMFLVEGLGHCFGLFYNYSVPFEAWNTEDSISFSSNCDWVMTGVPFQSRRSNLSIYPNPCDEYFSVSGGVGEMEIKVIDMRAALLSQGESSEMLP